MSWKLILIILLFAAISISPRLDIGQLETGRIVQLRYEDFILVLIVILLFFHSSIMKKKEFYITPLFKPILVYIVLATISTCIGIIASWIVPAMAFFFFLKEIEYFLIFFVVANLIKTYNELRIAIYSLLFCAIANGFYILYQVSTDRFAGGSYGAGSIGERGTFPTAGYLTIVFLLSISIFIVTKGKVMKLVSLVSVVVCGIGILSTGSRANLLGSLFSLSILLFFIIRESFKTKNYAHFVYTTLIILVMFVTFDRAFNYALEKRPALNRLTNIQGMKSSFFETRVESIYVVVLNEVKKNPFFGLGKTASTTVLGGTGAAHNYYLRILVEMGIVGLMFFLYLLLSIIRMSLELNRNSQSNLGKAIGLGCLLAIFSLMFASIAQDAFIPVKVNETFWALVGLGAAAYSIEFSKGSDEPLPHKIEGIS